MPNEIDICVGGKIRARRNSLKLSQTELASKLGITFQQVQKYERGSNRVGASRLYKISQILSVPVAYFFSDSESTLSLVSQNVTFPGKNVAQGDALNSGECVEFIEAYYKISDPGVRKKIADLIKSLSVV